jgi:DNA-binding winged helix-turn-helix (wHTH) protein
MPPIEPVAVPGLTICFGPFTFSLERRELIRGDEVRHLSTKAFDLLAALVAERPTVVSKAALQQRLWPETFVAEANLSNLIAEIRQALDDSSREPRYIRTVHRIGYAFSADAEVTAGPAFSAPLCWVEWGTQRIPLAAGEHVIGRDPDVAIRIDASTVSRRHARIVVSAERAVLEDFASKNGTFHGAARVSMPVTLADGDDIRIGSQLITFHAVGSTSTETHVEPAS